MISVINGNKKEKEEKLKARRRTISRIMKYNFLKECAYNRRPERIVFYGIRYISSSWMWVVEEDKSINVEELYFTFDAIGTVIDAISILTYRQFMNIFPIEKRYYNDNFSKDYYTTVNDMKGVDIDSLIGDNAIDFLSYYYNDFVLNFNVTMFMTTDRINMLHGNESFMSKFAREHGIATYIIHEDEGYIYNTKTQKTMPYKNIKPKKRKPKYLSPVG